MTNGCLPQSQWQITADPNCPGMGGDAFLSAFMAEHPTQITDQRTLLDPYGTGIGGLADPVLMGFTGPATTIGTPGAPGLAPSFPEAPAMSPPGSGVLPFSEVTTPPPPPFYEVPPLVGPLAPEIPFLGMLGGLSLLGLAGVGASLAVGAPAPDEYGIGDIQALIDAGFYGSLVPQYQPPDNPAQTELAPAVAPQIAEPTPNIGTITVTTSPIEVPQVPAYVVSPVAPVEVPGYVAIPRGNPAGLPAPGRAPGVAPGPAAAPGVAPAGAASPLVGVAPLPTGLPVQSPAASTAPATSTPTAPAAELAPTPSPLTTPVTGTSPAVSPLTDTQPQSQLSPAKPALAQLTQGGLGLGDLGSVPPRSKDDCKPNQQKKQQKKQQRKDRTVCHSGTYIERKHGLSKHAQRTVPCR